MDITLTLVGGAVDLAQNNVNMCETAGFKVTLEDATKVILRNGNSNVAVVFKDNGEITIAKGLFAETFDYAADALTWWQNQ